MSPGAADSPTTSGWRYECQFCGVDLDQEPDLECPGYGDGDVDDLDCDPDDPDDESPCVTDPFVPTHCAEHHDEAMSPAVMVEAQAAAESFFEQLHELFASHPAARRLGDIPREDIEAALKGRRREPGSPHQPAVSP